MTSLYQAPYAQNQIQPAETDALEAILANYLATDAELNAGSRRAAWILTGVSGAVFLLGAGLMGIAFALDEHSMILMGGGFILALLAGFPFLIGLFLFIASLLKGNDEARKMIRACGYNRVEVVEHKLTMHGIQHVSWIVEVHPRQGSLVPIKCPTPEEAQRVGAFLRARI